MWHTSLYPYSDMCHDHTFKVTSKVLSGTHFRETNHYELKVHFWKNTRNNQYCQIVIQEESMHFAQSRGSFLDFFKNYVNE